MDTPLPFPRTLSTKDELCEKAVALFEKQFGLGKPDVVACGPGRVNLIGEHTDYQEGYVFPIALDKKTVVAASITPGTWKIFSEDCNELVQWDALPEMPADKPSWWSYVVGVIRIFCEVTGATMPEGLSAVIVTSVPIGGGLSSSAALEVATAVAMEVLTFTSVHPVVMAENICQKAEHLWAKVPCGLMDQAISTMGVANHAMLFDCQSKKPLHAPLSPEIAFVVVDSGVRHCLVDGEYSKRKAHCLQAVEGIKKVHPEVTSLRCVDVKTLSACRMHIPNDAFTRASHVVKENVRSMNFFSSLQSGDFATAGSIMFEGHASLRDFYDVTVPETDEIVRLAKEQPGVYGARMTGGGFGGCVVIMADKTKANAVKDAVLAAYMPFFKKRETECTGSSLKRSPPVAFTVTAACGAHVYTA